MIMKDVDLRTRNEGSYNMSKNYTSVFLELLS